MPFLALPSFSCYHVLSVLFLLFVNDTINYDSRLCVCAFAQLSSPVPNLKEGGLIFDIGMKGWFVITAGRTAEQLTQG